MNNLNMNGEESDVENDSTDEIDDIEHNNRIEYLENSTYGVVVDTSILINQCNLVYQNIINFIRDNELTRDEYYAAKFDEIRIIMMSLNAINNNVLVPLLPDNNILNFNIGIEDDNTIYTLQQARVRRESAMSAKMDVSELVQQFNGVLYDLNLRNEQLTTTGGRHRNNFKNSRIKRKSMRIRKTKKRKTKKMCRRKTKNLRKK